MDGDSVVFSTIPTSSSFDDIASLTLSAVNFQDPQWNLVLYGATLTLNGAGVSKNGEDTSSPTIQIAAGAAGRAPATLAFVSANGSSPTVSGGPSGAGTKILNYGTSVGNAGVGGMTTFGAGSSAGNALIFNLAASTAAAPFAAFGANGSTALFGQRHRGHLHHPERRGFGERGHRRGDQFYRHRQRGAY